LLVSNHLSYTDIFILASQVDVCFTPKSEIADWPIIGYLCKLNRCIFVDRRRSKVKDTANPIQEALQNGDVVSLFPEGTTNNGVSLQPFKSSFFSLAESMELNVQPAAITYTHINRLPVDSTQWPKLAWYGDSDLVSHL